MRQWVGFISIFFLVTSQWLFAQHPPVEQSSYGLLLKGMLSHTTSQIGVNELHEKGVNYVKLDAREEREFQVSHINGAIHVGYDEFDWATFPLLSFTDTIVVYCSVGYRSEKIAERLIEEGYKNVYNLYGGIFEWKNAGYEVYAMGEITDEVHAFSKLWGKWLKKGVKIYD